MFCNKNNDDIDIDIYYPVKKHSFFCRNRNNCSCKYYATNYMVKMYYPVMKHSFFCLNRKTNNYACSCNYGIKYKTKYVHCSEVKSPYDLFTHEETLYDDEFCRVADVPNLEKYCFWLLKEKEKN